MENDGAGLLSDTKEPESYQLIREDVRDPESRELVGYQYYIEVPGAVYGKGRRESLYDSRLYENPLNEEVHDKKANELYVSRKVLHEVYRQRTGDIQQGKAGAARGGGSF